MEDEKKIYLEDGIKEYSYRDIENLKNRLAFTSNKLVICLIDNEIDGIAGYVAMQEANATIILLNKEISKEKLDDICQRFEPEFMFRERSEEESIIAIGNYELRRLRKKSPEIHEDLGLLLSTSGSTGNPKMIKVSRTNIRSNRKAIKEYLGLANTDSAITTMPPAYTYGLSIINSHYEAGGRIVVTKNSIITREFWKLSKEKEITNISGVPYHYELIMKLRLIDKIASLNIRMMTQAGGKLGEKQIKEIRKKLRNEIDLYIMYGQTEATARISYVPPKNLHRKIGSIGIAIPGGQLDILDERNGYVNKPYSKGEIVYRGNNVTWGYAKCKDELKLPDERKGILKTGDYGYYDDEGYFFITGRIKRFVKIYGKRINLDDIDKYLAEKGYVTISSEKNDEICIVLIGSKEQNEEKIIKKKVEEYLKTKIDTVRMRWVNEFPRLENKKIDYAKIKEMFLEE